MSRFYSTYLAAILLSLMALPVSASAQPVGLIDWKKEWFMFSRGEGDYAPKPVASTPSIFTRRTSTSAGWGRALRTRTPWFRTGTVQGTHADHAECNHSTFSASYNTPSRVPDQIPIDLAAGRTDPPTSESPMGNWRNPRSSRMAEILSAAAEKEAFECRGTADHVRRRTGKTSLCGNQSKGRCYQAVKDALLAAGIGDTRLPGNAAIEAHTKGYLKNLGFTNMGNMVSPAQAGEGCVIVYSGGSGHNYGHIEVKTSKGYCSDFCSARPLNSSSHRLAAVYCML